DHLGNVRVSYDNQNGSAVILEEESYYPYGLRHVNSLSFDAYQYKFNGKELQTDSGMYDYGARFYMPELGRWGVVDPLAEMSQIFSPYVYGNNNPIMFVDPDGRLSQGFMDAINKSPDGTVWTNNGIGFSNNLGGMMDYQGNALNFGSEGSLSKLN